MKKFVRLGTLVSLSLSAVLLLSACVGGNNAGSKAGDNSNESKSIRVFFSDSIGTDSEEVSKAVSKMSQEKIGVEVEMVFFAAGEYAQKMPRLMATNEKMDIGWDSGDNFVSRARDGAYYDISEDLAAYPALKELFNAEFLGGVTIDGGIYGIPTLKEMSNSWTVYLDKVVIDKHNIDTSKVKTVADLEPILAILKSEGRLGFRINNNGEHKAFDMEEHFDTITGPFVVSNNPNEKATSKKVVNYYETKEFEDYVRLLHSWYEKGYIMPDVLEVGMESYSNVISTQGNEKHGLIYVAYSPFNELVQERDRGTKVVPIQVTPATISNFSTRGSIFAIYNKSENKQSSLKFLELWNTDKEMNTLIKYGIEGKHYNYVEEDGVQKIQKAEGVSGMYLNQGWKSGNMLLGQIEVGESVDKLDVFEQWNKDSKQSCVIGFTPDLAGLEAELSACNSVVTTKVAAILTGAIDPDDPEFGVEAIKKEMRGAGSAKIATEIQKQYLNWLKEK